MDNRTIDSSVPPRSVVKRLLGITMGDVNGIGPEILAKALAHPGIQRVLPLVVFGDSGVLESMRRYAPTMPHCYRIDTWEQIDLTRSDIPVFDAGQAVSALHPGALDTCAGRCAVAWLEAAIAACMDERLCGLVTCPVSKEGMLLAGCPYAGHTPMLLALTGASDCHMSLFSGRMRIIHITAHLSLQEAVAHVTKDRIVRAVEVGMRTLRRIGFSAPRIAVAGLNPHAGEGGVFGDEEQREIAPAVAEARARGISCVGPIAPDTVFERMYRGDFDLVVAMYHDQGHIPFKIVSMDEGVHVTLGLPFIRSSPDHGVAYDIAGRGIAREHSLCAAIELAAQWVRHGVKPIQERI